MEFELLRLPPQSKTVGPWTFQQGGWGRRRGGARLCASLHHIFHTCTQCVKVACRMSCVCIRNVCYSLCSPILCVLPPPLPLPSITHRQYIHTTLCFNLLPCCPVLEGGLSLFPYLPDTQGASTTANGQQQLQGEGQGRGSLHQHWGTQQDHPSTSRPSESSYGDVCGAVMCEKCGGWVQCPRTANHATLSAQNTLCEPTLY